MGLTSAAAGEGSCGEGDCARGREASATGAGTSPGAARRRAGGCRGDGDEREANAGSAARGRKGETAKERLRRQTELNYLWGTGESLKIN